jgi:hypothetical protein
MNLSDPNEVIPEEKPADPTTQRKLRRSLLYIALGSMLAPCGLCWYSTRVQSIEGVMIPGIFGLVILIYTFYILYQREQRQDLAPPIWRVGLVFVLLIAITTLTMIWLNSAIGWHRISGPAILIMSAWAFFLAGRRVWESWSFSRQAVVEENFLTELKMVSIKGSHPIHPQLAYRYAENYRGIISNNQIRNRTPQIIEAIDDGKFLVKVKYLPDNPRVHRFLGWRILA